MKTLSILLPIGLLVTLAGCKKEDPDPPSNSCTLSCQNGGTVTSACECDCPNGFGGANCQLALPPIGIRITNVRLYDVDPYNGGTLWDAGGYPDVKVTIEKIGYGNIWPTATQNNCHPSQNYGLQVQSTTPLTNLNNSYRIVLEEYDSMSTGVLVYEMGVSNPFTIGSIVNDANGRVTWSWPDGTKVELSFEKVY